MPTAELVQVLSTDGAQPSTLLSADRLDGQRRLLILPDSLAEVELVARIDAEIVGIGRHGVAGDGVAQRPELLVDGEGEGHREARQAAGALKGGLHDQLGVDQHALLAAEQPHASADPRLEADLRHLGDLVLDRQVADRANRLVEQRCHVEQHDQPPVNPDRTTRRAGVRALHSGRGGKALAMQAVSYLRALPDCSLEAQQRAFLAECAAAGLQVGPTFTETDPTPSVPGAPAAPEFRHMLRTLLADQRGFAVVMVADLRVLGESVREQARRYLQLEALGLPLRLTGGGDVDAAVVEAWTARGGSERRREQVLAGMRQRALRGEVLGRAPYGYRVVDRHLRVQPEEAAVVREIFDRCLARGEGVRVIARALNEAGHRTRLGGAWSMVSVRGVLRNPVYTGTYRRLGVLVPGEHEPLITRDQFAAVQERLAARRTSFATQERGEYLLAGLATCGYCGNHLIGVRRASRARASGGGPQPALIYYQCESRTNQSRCDYHTRRAEDLETAVRAQLAQPANVALPASAPTTLPEIATDAHREGLRRRLDALLERRARGEWTADRLRKEGGALALADLEAEEAAEVVARRRADVIDAAGRQRAQGAARTRLVRLWDALPFAERRRLLRQVVAGIVVTDESVQVTLIQ